jgi:hypothetical protein
VEQVFVFNEIIGELIMNNLIMNKMMVFCCCIIAAGFVFPACSHCSYFAAGKDNVVVHEVGTSSDANCMQVDQSQYPSSQASHKGELCPGVFTKSPVEIARCMLRPAAPPQAKTRK